MKTHPRLFTKLFLEPLMLLPSARYGFELGLLNHMGLAHSGTVPQMGTGSDYESAPVKTRDEQIADMKAAQQTQKEWRVARIYEQYGNVAIIKMNGAIDKHLTDFEMSCYGGYDLADFDNALSRAANDPKIDRVVLDINSPGGSVIGVPESAARVAALTQVKEVHSFVDMMACSAAQYIAAQADVTACAPSALLGSIGVYLSVVDATRWAEIEGYKVEIIRAGNFKAMGNPFKPLTDAERALLQTRVNEIHTEFQAAVNAGRKGAVSDDDMQGQVIYGKDAVAKGLADIVTGQNLDEYVASLL